MATEFSPIPPRLDSNVTASAIWTIIDTRVMRTIRAVLNQWGKPRSRTMTINIPLAGLSTPTAGWVASVGIANNIKIVGWEINALVRGQITVDLRVSTIQALPGSAAPVTTILGTANFLKINGFTTSSQDTSAWLTNQISAGAFLHAFVSGIVSIAQAVLVLRVIDMDSKTLSP